MSESASKSARPKPKASRPAAKSRRSPSSKPRKSPAKKAKAVKKVSKKSPAKRPAKKTKAGKPRKSPAKKGAKKRTTAKPARPKPKAPPTSSAAPPDVPSLRLNTTAAAATIAALEADNRIGPDQAAVITLVQTLAFACDMAPDNASLWREYRQALAMLLGEPETDPGGDEDGPSKMDELRKLLAAD